MQLILTLLYYGFCVFLCLIGVLAMIVLPVIIGDYIHSWFQCGHYSRVYEYHKAIQLLNEIGDRIIQDNDLASDIYRQYGTLQIACRDLRKAIQWKRYPRAKAIHQSIQRELHELHARSVRQSATE